MITAEKIIQTMNSWEWGELIQLIPVGCKKSLGTSSHSTKYDSGHILHGHIGHLQITELRSLSMSHVNTELWSSGKGKGKGLT